MTDIKIQMSEQECKNAYLVEEKHITHFFPHIRLSYIHILIT